MKISIIRPFTAGLVLAAVCSGCGYSEEEMQAKQARIDELTLALDESERKNADLQNKFDDLSAQNAQIAERLKAQNVSVEQLQQALQQLKKREQQAEAQLQTFRNMLERFKNMIASGKLRVRIVRGRMVVELAENILFDSGKADLTEPGQVALAEVAEVLKTIPDRDFQIAGHTDNVPIRSRKFPSNWELSTARAVIVTKFLADHGVPTERLSAAGHAETQPVASNDTPEGKAQNRRIEIVLMPKLDELPDLSALENLGSK
ncbi:MAG: OmpA family protein [Deltaproteobacteria bacterium]|nr:OmpA family protein [Deltaproteobacteria bacterium]